MNQLTFQKILAQTVAKLRQESCISTEELANQIGVPAQLLAEMENGDTVIPIEQLRKIAEHLGINTGKIVDGAEEIGRGFESKGIPVDWDTRQIKNQDAALLGGLVIGAIITYLLVKK